MRVRFAQRARAQLLRAIAYIHAENPHPHAYREVLVYPHRLIYREASGEVVVVAVIHVARDLARSGALDPDPER